MVDKKRNVPKAEGPEPRLAEWVKPQLTRIEAKAARNLHPAHGKTLPSVDGIHTS